MGFNLFIKLFILYLNIYLFFLELKGLVSYKITNY